MTPILDRLAPGVSNLKWKGPLGAGFHINQVEATTWTTARKDPLVDQVDLDVAYAQLE